MEINIVRVNNDNISLRGVSFAEYYPDGSPKECVLTEMNNIKTLYGVLVPQYERDEGRRKFINSASFYNGGVLKSISLQLSTNFFTSLGSLPAELATFYNNGQIKRIFPLDGKLSGYWSEANEYDLAPHIKFKLPIGEIILRPISIYFYESGEVKSLTLWPREQIAVPTSVGIIIARTGVSFYQTGVVSSLEPLRPTLIKTPIGQLKAYDIDALGICGDQNSLCFDQNGEIKSLKTHQNTVEVKSTDGKIRSYSPKTYMSHFSDELLRVVPMIVSFSNGKVFFDDSEGIEISENEFIVSNFDLNQSESGNECPGC